MTITSTGKLPTVLLVDDNPKTLHDTETFLQRSGMGVISANSPFGVTALVHRHDPDAIVLDVMMPGLSGEGLACLIRKESQSPIVYFSAMPEEDLRDLVSRTPNAWYVLKSEGLIYLNEVIERRLRCKRNRSNRQA
jgi:DNA-binding response OmpR family regulator